MNPLALILDDFRMKATENGEAFAAGLNVNPPPCQSLSVCIKELTGLDEMMKRDALLQSAFGEMFASMVSEMQ